jgi:hypothetical protein
VLYRAFSEESQLDNRNALAPRGSLRSRVIMLIGLPGQALHCRMESVDEWQKNVSCQN